MRIAAGADLVGQQHTVEPAVDDAVAWAQRDAATRLDEVRQRMLGVYVDRLRIGRGVTEGLHHQVGGKAEAGQFLEFVAGHRTGGVLATDCAHARLTIGARADAGDAAGVADHLLRQRETLAAVLRIDRPAEDLTVTETQRFTRLGGQAATDDQRDTATGTIFVGDSIRLDIKG